MSFTEFTINCFKDMIFTTCTKNTIVRYRWAVRSVGKHHHRNRTHTKKISRQSVCNYSPSGHKSRRDKVWKTEGGNVWLDANRTSPYKFYQYWFNSSDEDSEKYIKIFTFLDQETINQLIEKHQEAPHLRLLQKKIGEELTVMTHGQEAYENVIKATNILFGKSTAGDLKSLDEQTFLDVFDGVPQASISKQDIKNGLDMIGALAAKTGFLKSNGDARRALKEFYFR